MTPSREVWWLKLYLNHWLVLLKAVIPMPSYSHVDTPTKNRIIGFAQATGNAAAAGRKENVDPRTAQRIYKRYKDTGSAARKKGSGPPTKLTDHDRREIIRTARKNRRMALGQVRNQVTADISTSTIRRVLADDGYHRRVARKVPYLTKNHKQARLAWARRNKAMNHEDWGRVIFSDECYIYLGDKQGRIYITRRADEVMVEECLVPTFKQSSVRVMVWGCIIEGEKGPLVVLEYPGGKGGGMNSARYQNQVLQSVLTPFYTQKKAQKGNVLFQQDSAASHRGKSTLQWFTQNGISLFGHPASSPDLNPIEPVWLDLKNILRHLTHPPNTVEQLQAAVLSAWEQLPIDSVNRQIEKMGDRVNAILAVKGGHTSF
jgi:transposase